MFYSNHQRLFFLHKELDVPWALSLNDAGKAKHKIAKMQGS